jgi:hypothetical protein
VITFASNQPIEFFLNVTREGKRIEKQAQAKNLKLYHLYQASESSFRNSTGFFFFIKTIFHLLLRNLSHLGIRARADACSNIVKGD